VRTPDYKDYQDMIDVLAEAIDGAHESYSSLKTIIRRAEDGDQENMTMEEMAEFESAIDRLSIGMVSITSLIGTLMHHHHARWKDHPGKESAQDLVAASIAVIGSATFLLWRERIAFALTSYAEDNNLDQDDPSVFVTSEDLRKYIRSQSHDGA
jgi:hypothetical protein